MARLNEFKKDTPDLSERQIYYRNYYRKNKEKLREYNRKYYLRKCMLTYPERSER